MCSSSGVFTGLALLAVTRWQERTTVVWHKRRETGKARRGVPEGEKRLSTFASKDFLQKSTKLDTVKIHPKL